jgi:hypothetical protein
VIVDVPGIPLRRRDGTVLYTLVDAEDFVWLNEWRWTYSNGYVVRRDTRRPGPAVSAIFRMHREIMGLTSEDAALVVDHINCDPLDNRRANLRIATQAENNQNVRSRAGTSQHRGVHRSPLHKSRPWVAEVKHEGRRILQGYFATELEAADAARAARLANMPFSVEEVRA